MIIEMLSIDFQWLQSGY